MKKRIFPLLLIACLLMGLGTGVRAAGYGGTVTFDGSSLNSSYTIADLTDAVSAIQPGDDITITISLRNAYTAETDWWMNNLVQGFEDNSTANGGAYTYNLTYQSPNGNSLTLYSSETVGGTDSAGLREATSGLQNFVYLDTLKSGQTGTVTLYIALDGETSGNSYQNTLADLAMRFAVELTPENESRTGTSTDVVKTGDETEIMPYLIVSAVSGVLLLLVAVLRLSKSIRKRQQGGI